jgi:hypothetical protein
MPIPDKFDRRSLALLKRFAVSSVVCSAMMALYLFINRRPLGPVTVFEMPAWVPFWPAFLLPYLGLLGVTLLLPVAIQDKVRFRACLQGYACAFLLVAPWWVITPTMLLRPPLPDGLWSHAFAWIWEVDQPYNVTPCAHVVGPIIAAWFAAQEYPRWRWPLVAVLLLTLPSIAFVCQHRPIDILLGAIAAAIGITVVEALARASRERARRLDPNAAPAGRVRVGPRVTETPLGE